MNQYMHRIDSNQSCVAAHADQKTLCVHPLPCMNAPYKHEILRDFESAQVLLDPAYIWDGEFQGASYTAQVVRIICQT
jgi:hypothetical protein